MRSRAKVLFAVVSCLALLALTGAALAAQVYVPAQSSSGPGSEDGQLDKPRRAAIEQASGNLFLADSGNGRVQVFAPDGSFITSFGQTELDAPFGIAIHESGGETEVYVSDPASNQILRYDSDEAATPSFTVDGSFASPAQGAGQLKVGDFAAALAVDPTSGDLWVADPDDDRAQRYDSSGAFELANDGSDSPGGAFAGLLDVAVDSSGRLYAIDSDGFIANQPDGTAASGQSRVERFSASGEHQLTLGGLTRPATVAVDLATDEVAVSADQNNVDDNGEPSLHVYDSSGTKFDELRMGSATQYTTVHGLAWRSSDQDVFAVNHVGYWGGSPLGTPSINRFELAEEPSASIDPVANITATGADFSGTVNPGGNTTTARFEISTDGGSSWSELEELSVCEVSAPGDCTGDMPVNFTATGLAPNTGYGVRLVARSVAGTIASATESFTTDTAPPAVETVGATQRSDTSAALNGVVNPYGEATTYYFEYGTSPGTYTISVPLSEDADAGSGNESLPVSLPVEGLEPETTYYFRLVAENASGASEGAESSFKTLPAGKKAPTTYALVNTFADTGPLYGGAGTADGELNAPHRAAVEVATGNLLVASGANGRVEVFQRSGDSADFLTRLGEGVLSAPFGIAIDQDSGDVYVSDAGLNQIVKFNSDGAPTPSYSVDSSFVSPPQGSEAGQIGDFNAPLAYDSATDELFVGDPEDDLVQRYDSNGGFISAFDGSSSPRGPFSNLTDIALDGEGDVIVASDEAAQRFSAGGAHELTITDADARLLAADPVNDYTFVIGGFYAFPTTIRIYEGKELVAEGVPPGTAGFMVGGLALDPTQGSRLYWVRDGFKEQGLFDYGYVGIDVFEGGTLATVAVDAPTADSTTAAFSGTVDPQGRNAEWYFEYRSHGGVWVHAPVPHGAASGDDPVPVSTAASDLIPATEYEVRLVARSQIGTATSAVESFTTEPDAPGATTFGAAPRTTTMATLNARISPYGSTTTYYFEFGESDQYGQQLPATPEAISADDVRHAVGQEVTGLKPDTTYHFRVVAESEHGTTTSPDRVFRTRTAAEMSLPARGFELVNTPDKGNGDPLGAFGPKPLMSEDANRVIWGTCCGTPNSPVGLSAYMARRTPDSPTGWTSKSVIPPQTELGKYFIPQDLVFLNSASTPDWSNGLLEVQRADNGITLAVAEDDYTKVRPVYAFEPDGGDTGLAKFVASRDLSRILMLVPERIDPEHPEGVRELYDVGDGTPELVSRMPDGSVPSCGVIASSNLGQYYGFATSFFPHWMSHDGGTVFFETAGNKKGCGLDTDLYVRDLERGATELVSGPPVAGPSKPARLIRASEDGRRAVFATETRLDAEDLDELNDLYLWTEGSGSRCLTCEVPSATVDSPGNRSVIVSRDLSYVYFSSRRTLVAGQGSPQPSDPSNLYVWHGGEIDYVGPGEAHSRLIGRGGSVFVFGSAAPNVTSESVGGITQYYRYDHADRSLECVTCPGTGLEVLGGDGPRLESASLSITEEDNGSLSADGSTLAFITDSPLVSEDINGTRDIYEWRNGTFGLVTDGETRYTVSKMILYGVSADGTAILFALQDHLTGFERDSFAQIYQARRGGGFYAPSPVPPCREDDCQGPLEPVPPLAPVGSAAFQGPGNPAVKKQKKKQRAKQKKRRAKQKKKQAKNRQASKQGRR